LKGDTKVTQIKAAIIGCGNRGRAHAQGYAASHQVQIVALVDPLPEAARGLAEKHDVGAVYPNHQEMLAAERPDIVSICTWTGLHAQMVLDVAAAGVKAIHCEKPMAPTWGEARRMHRACEEAGVQLTFCHQRRFGAQFVKTRELIRSGAIGTVHRLEGFCPNLFDWGTHWFDMFFFYNGETPARWVMGQIDTAQVKRVYGVPVESSGLSYVQFSNNVHCLLATGAEAGGGGCRNRILGSEGMIEVAVTDGPRLRVLRSSGSGWEVPDLEGVAPAGGDTTLSVLDAIDCLRTGREPTLSSRNAVQATELIFATYESARRRARVTLPLDIEDSPLLALLPAEEASVLLAKKEI
jgi:predicted dehydrogenase